MASHIQTSSTLLATDLREHFDFFGIPVYASRPQLDDVYMDRSLKLARLKPIDREFVKSEQEEIDEHYYHLIQFFIRVDCHRGQLRRATEMYLANIESRRRQARSHRRSHRNDDEMDTNLNFWDGDEMEDSSDEDENEEEENTQNDDNVVVPAQSTGVRLFQLIETEGDIFDAPEGSVIVHAVNCLGVWGSGFAFQLRIRFPGAFTEYSDWCRNTSTPTLLVGNCLLIPPQREDYAGRGKPQPRRWIACLFTSVGYGGRTPSRPGMDEEDAIISQTDSALLDLRNKLTAKRQTSDKPGDIFSPRINAGRFQVQWSRTERTIRICFAGFPATWTVIKDSESDAL